MREAGGWEHFGFYALECIVSIPMRLEDPINQLEDGHKNLSLPNTDRNF